VVLYYFCVFFARPLSALRERPIRVVTVMYQDYLPHKRIQALIVLLLVACTVLQLLMIALPDSILIVLGSLSILGYFVIGWRIVAFWYDKARFMLQHAETPEERMYAEHTALWIMPLARFHLHTNRDEEDKKTMGGTPTATTPITTIATIATMTPKPKVGMKIAPTPAPASAPSPTHWFERQHNASEMQWSRFLRSQYLWSWVAYIIILLSLLGLFHFYSQIFGQSQPFYSLAQLRDMDNRADYTPFEATVQGTAKNHVLLVVLDGLRLDTSRDHEEWIALLTDPAFVSHLIVSESRAALPTVSLPNWATIVTGLPPDGTGIMGNVFITQTSVDTFFHRLRVLDAPVDLHDLGPDAEYGDWNATAWFDNQQQANAQTAERVVIGSPSYVQLVLPALTPIAGQGAVPVLLRDEGIDSTTDTISFVGVTSIMSGVLQSFAPLINYQDSDTEFAQLEYEESDALRTHLASRWITERVPASNRSSVLLLHLESADHRAHAHGIDSRGYQRGVKLYAKMVRRLFSLALEFAPTANLTILVTSDHGHVVSGGHGGVQDVLRRVPLLAFDMRINDTSHTLAAAKANAKEVRKRRNNVVDLATSVSMLLGVPVPRQTTGKWIEEIVPLLQGKGLWEDVSLPDLYESQRVLLLYFMIQAGLSRDAIASVWNTNPSVRSVFDLVAERGDAYGAQCVDEPMNLTDMYRLAIYEIHGLYEQQRELVLITLVVRNFVAVAMVSNIVLLFFWWRFALFGDIAHEHAPCTTMGWFRIQTAWLWALGMCVLYVACTLTIYHTVYAALGYPTWDSTQLHSNVVIVRFVLLVFVPGLGVMWLAFRVLIWLSLHPRRKWVFETRTQTAPLDMGSELWVFYLLLYQVWVWVFVEYYVWTLKIRVSKQRLRYFVFRFYSFLLVTAATLGVLVFMLESVMGFYVPMSINVAVIAERIWEFRFRVLSFHAMMVPLMLGAIFYYTVSLHAVWLSLNKSK